MLATLAAALVVALVVALGLALLYAVTVVPLLLALGMAERRGFGTARWGALAIAGVLVGLAAALLVRLGGLHLGIQLLALMVTFSAPMALWLLGAGDRLGGRAGRHESPV